MSNQASYEQWEQSHQVFAYLVALDISGFSNDVNPDVLTEHRLSFFQSVESTRLFQSALAGGNVKVHFLGDELRLAFRTQNVKVKAVRDFVHEVFEKLAKVNRDERPGKPTRLKGVVLEGPIMWKQWHGCGYLHGELTGKAQRWTSKLAADHVAIDADFRSSLQHADTSVRFESTSLLGEDAYFLRT